MIDLVDMIFFHAGATPEKPAVITGQVILTYGMLRSGILSAQRHLRQQGLKSGDVVALSGFAPVGHVTLICALHRSGIASVSLEGDQLSLLDHLVINAHLTSATTSQEVVRTIVVDDSWFTDKDAEVDRSPMQAADDDRPCRYILSSGTTGRPKIIALSFGAVRERLISYSIRASTPSWDRMVCEPGLATNYGYSFMVTTLWLGRTICFALETSVREAILSNQAELLVASTHQIMALVQAQEQQFFRLDSLRSVHIGGSVAYAPLQARIRMMVCPTLHCGYGSTEGGTVAYSPAEAIILPISFMGISSMRTKRRGIKAGGSKPWHNARNCASLTPSRDASAAQISSIPTSFTTLSTPARSTPGNAIRVDSIISGLTLSPPIFITVFSRPVMISMLSRVTDPISPG
jgi:acyl-coenzyme A synthetase/AMP-(fatty) acid ligase